ncbi:hypothetical protein [Pantoea sp.]|uniref:hypothetical protein n=1 Tax=Pantoea sp. TaxID=69393 RepID=UPI0031DE5F24
MKNIKLIFFPLLLVLALVGCDDEKKTDCSKDRHAEGCPLYEGNIKHSKPETWTFGGEKKKPSKEDQ